jgi:hypothetical protein
MRNVSFQELLKFLGECSGDEAIEFIHQFQCGAITIEQMGVSDDDFND